MPVTNASIKTLKDFYSAITTKGLRTNHMFQLEFAGGDPLSKPYIDQLNTDNYIVYAQSAAVPGRQIVNEAVSFYGFPFQVPVNTTYVQTWDCNVRCDKDVQIRDIFEGWMNSISDLSKSTGGSKGIVPVGTYALLHLLSPDFFNASGNANIVRTYKMMGIYPSNLGNIEQDHNSNAITTFSTTFTFQYWYPVRGDETGDGIDPLAP
jgi:hypothetical protein